MNFVLNSLIGVADIPNMVSAVAFLIFTEPVQRIITPPCGSDINGSVPIEWVASPFAKHDTRHRALDGVGCT